MAAGRCWGMTYSGGRAVFVRGCRIKPCVGLEQLGTSKSSWNSGSVGVSETSDAAVIVVEIGSRVVMVHGRAIALNRPILHSMPPLWPAHQGYPNPDSRPLESRDQLPLLYMSSPVRGSRDASHGRRHRGNRQGSDRWVVIGTVAVISNLPGVGFR